MLQLTPLEQTVAGQELIQIGRAQGRLIGEIQMAEANLEVSNRF